ncbi:hypothetical protein [Namhaeicola litoreus]|uniref:Lipoprotein n=1 Tax=Namhaeicola litoreus TaxID=1052145 RepID=A0ABW3XXZ1_9FLAO
MKLRLFQHILILFVFNSCIVLSIHPFYTKESIYFEKKLIGNWEDQSYNEWKIIPFKEYYLRKQKQENLSADSIKFLKKYIHAYLITYQDEKNQEIEFVGMPFKIDNNLFIDFYLSSCDCEIDELASMHLAPLHSLAKVELLNKNSLNLVWLGDEKFKHHIDENKIKIKYEKIGLKNDQYILSDDSENLEKFIKRYMNSAIPNKWESGEEQVEIHLTKKDG